MNSANRSMQHSTCNMAYLPASPPMSMSSSPRSEQGISHRLLDCSGDSRWDAVHESQITSQNGEGKVVTGQNSNQKGEGRVMILCFDGTGNKFGANSNVVRFFRALKKDVREKQIVYYQPGIGTYSKRTFITHTANAVASTVDAAFALGLDDHVKDGYQFIVQNYQPGDRICVFGFSRGAHTARVVAGMVYKVGVLPKENIQQVDFAFSIYSSTGYHGYNLSQEFKQTFTPASAEQVSVDFVGVWDTVSSVGLIPQVHPYTSVNYAVKKFRHALSLDERRARFRPNVWSEITLEREHELDVDIPVSDFPDTGESNRDKFVYKPPKRNFADVKEVWFAGTHADVGGGSHPATRVSSLSFIPLRWMVKECILSKTGILFDLKYLKDDLDFDFDVLLKEIGNEAENIIQYNELEAYRDAQLKERAEHHETKDTTNVAPQPEHPQKHQLLIQRLGRYARDILDEIFDQLVMFWYLWGILEVIPMLYTYQDHHGNWIRRRMRNFGRGRYIPVYKGKVLVHRSVKERIQHHSENAKKQDGTMEKTSKNNEFLNNILDQVRKIGESFNILARFRNREKGERPDETEAEISGFFNILRDRFRNREKYTPRAYNWKYLQQQKVIEYVD